MQKLRNNYIFQFFYTNFPLKINSMDKNEKNGKNKTMYDWANRKNPEKKCVQFFGLENSSVREFMPGSNEKSPHGTMDK